MTASSSRTESTIMSLTLVISPVVSLITDQVVDLRSKGVGSAVLTSESGRISRDLVASKQDLEKSSLLFCAPEALPRGRPGNEARR